MKQTLVQSRVLSALAKATGKGEAMNWIEIQTATGAPAEQVLDSITVLRGKDIIECKGKDPTGWPCWAVKADPPRKPLRTVRNPGFAYLVIDRGGNIVPGTQEPYMKKKDAINSATAIGGVDVYETFWNFDLRFQGKREAQGGQIIFKAPAKNPAPVTRAKAARVAKKKAEAWYWDKRRVTEPQELKGYVPPASAVLVGRIVAIEYQSTKDGTSKIYRHEVTGKRDLLISTDGGTLIINPPFRVTKRGIEG